MSRYAGVTLRGDETVDELRQALRTAGHHPASPRSSAELGRVLFFPVFLDHVEALLPLQPAWAGFVDAAATGGALRLAAAAVPWLGPVR